MLNAVQFAYSGGVFSPSLNRIYFIPYSQASQTEWHFIDCFTGNVVSYIHNSNAVYNAYSGGVYSIELNRTYLVPFDQAKETYWHYIRDSEDNSFTTLNLILSTLTEINSDYVTSKNSIQESSPTNYSFKNSLGTETLISNSLVTQFTNKGASISNHSIQESFSQETSVNKSYTSEISFTTILSEKGNSISRTNFNDMSSTSQFNREKYTTNITDLNSASSGIFFNESSFYSVTESFKTSFEALSTKNNQQIPSLNLLISIRNLFY